MAIGGVSGTTGRVDISLWMNPMGITFAGLVRRLSLAALAAGCLITPTMARAMSTPAGDENLSPPLAELSSPALGSVPEVAQAAEPGLASRGPGSLLRDGNRVLVDVRFDHGASAGVDALRDAGAEIVQLSRRYQTVTVAARPADLADLGSVAGVGGVTEILTPLVRGADCGGFIRSEGDVQLNAGVARASFGVDGSGVTVGILSDSFDRNKSAVTHAGGDVASGDLPGPGSPCGSTSPVGVLDDSDAEGADEGRAMGQIVHDLAPGASIDFASAFGGELKFAANIKAMASAGAKVIADDVTYFGEPFFQDGPVAQAVNEATAAGVSYFSAAGNDNLIDEEGDDIASWEAPEYRDSGTCPPAIVSLSEEVEEAEEEAIPMPEGIHPTHCMDFDPGAAEDETFGITVEAGAKLSVDLQWAEPWFGVGTDIDAFLLNEAGELAELEGGPFEGAKDNVAGSQTPFEFLSWKNPGPEQKVQLVLNRFSGALPRLKFALLENGRGVHATEYPKSVEEDIVGPTVFGHSGAASAMGVGAVPFNDGSEPEEYSSRGPVTHYFGPVTGNSAAAPLVPETISKPDIAATDCGATTFFSFQEGGIWRFCGTSAAAPHAAAVAALVRQANPGASAAQVRADLTSTARPVGVFGPSAVGSGLLNAYTAVDSLALPPTVTITQPPPPLSRDPRPTIQFTANRPVAFSCSVDAVPSQPCASPFTVPAALGDGEHRIAVTGTDISGRVGSGISSFKVDTTAPGTRILRHPPKLVRSRHRRVPAAFRFGSNESEVTFLCKVDRGPFSGCGARFLRRYAAGQHVVRVKARDQAGNVGSAVVFRFRVKRIG